VVGGVAQGASGCFSSVESVAWRNMLKQGVKGKVILRGRKGEEHRLINNAGALAFNPNTTIWERNRFWPPPARIFHEKVRVLPSEKGMERRCRGKNLGTKTDKENDRKKPPEHNLTTKKQGEGLKKHQDKGLYESPKPEANQRV